MRSYHFQNDRDGRGSVLTKFQPVISYGGPNSSHFDQKLYMFAKNIVNLGSHHLTEHNEAGCAPLDPPRRGSMKVESLSKFCNTINSFLQKVFGKPAPEGGLRVGTFTP